MTAPDPLGVTESSETSWTKTHTIALGTYVAGDKLIALWGMTGSGGTVTGPSGWTQVLREDLNSNQKWGVWLRTMDGSEGTSIQVATTLNNKSASQVIRVSGASQGDVVSTDWDVAVATAGYGSSLDPPSLAQTWGSGDVTYFALGFAAGSGKRASTRLAFGFSAHGIRSQPDRFRAE